MDLSKTAAVLALAALAPLNAFALAQAPDLVGAQADVVLAAIQQAKKQAAAPHAPKPAAAPKKADAGLGASDADWAKIFALVQATGTFVEAHPPFLPSSIFTLKDLVGDEKGEHTDKEVSVMGEINDDEQFEAHEVMIGDEAAKRGADGNLHVDQWVFYTDLYGKVQHVAHEQILVGSKNQIIAHTPDNPSPADAHTVEKFQSLIAFWAAHK